MNILVLNAGSSSLKMCLYAMDRPRPLTEPETVLAVGEIERIGGAGDPSHDNAGFGQADPKNGGGA